MMTVRRVLASMMVLPLLAMTGCGDDDATPRETTMTGASAGSTSSSPATTGPLSASDVLALGGLALPANTSGVTAEQVDASAMQWLEVYRVSFTAPRSNALQTCQTGGMGDLPSTGLTAADEELLGPSVTHVDGMRTCSSTWPENSAWDRLVVIAPGDPATVHVAISKMGR